MPLETGDYISDLVETNPPGTDNVSQGDDHLRLIKHVLKETFPNIDGPVTSTDEELSNLSGGMPLVTVYSNPASATHTFEVGRKWYKIIITGGGGAVANANRFGWGGFGGATAIKVAAITELSATYVIGAGGSAGTAGEASTWDEGAVVQLSAGGGAQGPASLDVGVASTATGGDLNIPGGGAVGINQTGAGGGTYWGQPSSAGPDDTAYPIYGCGGRGGQSSGDQDYYGCPGANGVIIIEEY